MKVEEQKLLQTAIGLHQTGQLDPAEKIYRQILAFQKENSDALHLLGVIACQRQQFDQGLELISRAISLSPRVGEYHNSLGNALSGLKRFPESIASFRKAGELDPTNLAALNNLAVALDHEDYSAEALLCFDRLIAARNDIAHWHVNRGTAQYNAGDLAGAIDSQRKAISLQKGLVGAHVKLASALLSAGQFLPGWQEYEWRFRNPAIGDPTIGDPAPIWDGTPVLDKTILVQGEMGLGDVLQCARYLPLVAQNCASVILRCKPVLQQLLARSKGVAQTISPTDPGPPHDLQVPIFSLPLLFHSDEQTIPGTFPYVFADENKINRYAENAHRKKVGLVWAGTSEHGNDRRRSFPADTFNILAGIDAIDFYRLQMPSDLAPPTVLKLIDRTADIEDFDDTAALVANLDLVISADTSVAHLAGAMGKPVWILLPYAAEWRWLTHREDSPWYPTARLFRQSSPGDWAGVSQRVREALLSTPTLPTISSAISPRKTQDLQTQANSRHDADRPPSGGH